MNRLSCYMCQNAGTTMEHAPPRCLFPERKDLPPGTDYRKKLITVRSCEAHNSERSHDDEYLLFALAGSYTSSQVGLTQFITKVNRAFQQRPSKATNFVQKSAPVRLRRADTEWEDGLQIIIEGDRIDRVLENCARALYFHQTKKRFLGRAIVRTNFTMYQDSAVQEHVTKAFEMAERTLDDDPQLGENPDVFWYKFKESDATAFFFLCFYGQSTAMVVFRKILIAA